MEARSSRAHAQAFPQHGLAVTPFEQVNWLYSRCRGSLGDISLALASHDRGGEFYSLMASSEQNASPGNRQSDHKANTVDVARLAGLSRTTVSYVLNNREDVSIPAATRERVRRAAAQLGYRPNVIAR